MTVEDRSLIAAMEVLKKYLGDNTLAVAANTQRSEKDFAEQGKALKDFVDGKTATDPRAAAPGGFFGGGGAGAPRTDNRDVKAPDSAVVDKATASLGAAGFAGRALTSVLGTVTARFAAIVGPSAILQQALNAPISGLGVLNTSARVLGSSLAPILLPASVVISTALLALSDIVNEEVGANLEDFAALIFDEAIPALVALVQAIRDVVDLVKKSPEDSAPGVLGGGIGDLFGEIGNVIGDEGLPAAVNEWVRRNFGKDADVPGELEAGGTGDRARRSVDSGLRDTLASLRNSLGPRASIGSLESVGRSAQIAALSGDPLEVRIMRQQLTALEKIERGLSRSKEARRVYDEPRLPTDGDFSGRGAGGDFGREDF